MASKTSTDSLNTLIANLSNFNLSTALKENLGDQSVAPRFQSRIKDIIGQLKKTQSIASQVSDGSIRTLMNAATQLLQALVSMGNQNAASFVQARDQLSNQLDSQIDQVDNALIPFKLIIQENMLRELLEPDKSNLTSIQQSLKSESEAILGQVRKEAETIIADAKMRAGTIQSAARDTASGVSLIVAQDQFATLVGNFKTGAWVAGLTAAVAFVIFFIYAIYLLYHQPELATYPETLFAIAIRITILGSLATVVGVALKVFKSNLHLLYHTLHRRQLTNTIPTFVDAARTDEQRDIIFVKLVEAVSSFGSSGLIEGSEDVPNTSKIIVDLIPKLASKLVGKD